MEEKGKHTKGPWQVTDTGNTEMPAWVQTMDFVPIANFNFVGDGNQQANARLIAAAPELLEALKSLRNNVDGLRAFENEIRQSIGNTNWQVIRDKIAEADAAIDNAEA